MKRVKKSLLDLCDGKYYLDGDLFTGIVYSIIGNVVESLFSVKDGSLSNKPNDLFGFEKYRLSIDASHLDEDLEKEPFVYEGHRFTGVAYGFDDGFCVSAQAYMDGYITKEVGWFKSGVLGFYEGFCEGVGEFATWHEGGGRNIYKVSEQGFFRLEADFDQPDKLKRLSIFGSLFERLSEVSDKLLFPLVGGVEQLKEIKMSDSLYLSGDGIDGDVFGALVSSAFFANVRKLHLSNTALIGNSIVEIKACENIKELILDDEKHELTDAIDEFQVCRPDCIVKFNK
jgi:hypothetical protein